MLRVRRPEDYQEPKEFRETGGIAVCKGQVDAAIEMLAMGRDKQGAANDCGLSPYVVGLLVKNVRRNWKLGKKRRKPKRYRRLTPEQRQEILSLYNAGVGPKEIGRRLRIKKATVQDNISRRQRKTSLSVAALS